MTRPAVSEPKVSTVGAADNASVQASPNGSRTPIGGSMRLSLTIGYFGVMAWLMGLISAGMATALLFPQLGWHVEPGKHPYVGLAAAVILTFGFARTRKLLRMRARMGGVLAISMFAIALIEDFTTGSRGWAAVAFSALGLVLVSSIWKYLDKDEP